MAVSRERAKGRSSGRRFIQLYSDVINHPNYVKLYDRSRALFIDLLSQYNGHNNGDLCAAMTLMEVRGWTSNSKLGLALLELRYYEFVVLSRQGGRNKASLLAVTCFPIDECNGKHDLRSTKVAPNNYKVTKKKWKPPKKNSKEQIPCPTSGVTLPHIRGSNSINTTTAPQAG